LSGCGRFSKSKTSKSGRDAKVDRVIAGASLVNMDTPDNPDLQATRRADEWFLREVEQGIAAADGGRLVEHSEVRKLIDERYPG
jgi:hypothetical protein